MSDRVGQRFGEYRLIRFLGEGTFGDVYVGQHMHQEAPAAIKVFKTKLTPDKLKDFINEVRTVLLRHPNIVKILDFGIEGDIPFIVMEYAPNGTLLQRHPRGTQLPIVDIISYVEQIAAALQYAHDHRRIHRDVKPENMLFGSNNEVLLSDFGIAAVVHQTSTQSIQAVAGTALYMAPEQFEGKPNTASDQYALGVIVYEWLCGTPPFKGTFIQLGFQHTYNAPPSLQDRLPSISPDIEHVVMTALAKDPKQRFAKVQSFAVALEQASRSELPQIIAPAQELLGASQPPQPAIISDPEIELVQQHVSQAEELHAIISDEEQPVLSQPPQPVMIPEPPVELTQQASQAAQAQLISPNEDPSAASQAPRPAIVLDSALELARQQQNQAMARDEEPSVESQPSQLAMMPETADTIETAIHRRSAVIRRREKTGAILAFILFAAGGGSFGMRLTATLIGEPLAFIIGGILGVTLGFIVILIFYKKNRVLLVRPFDFTFLSIIFGLRGKISLGTYMKLIKRLQPYEISLRLERAMKDNVSSNKWGKVFVPNRYDIYLNIGDYEDLAYSLRSILIQDWKENLVEFANHNNFKLLAMPVLRVHYHYLLPPGIIYISVYD